MDIGLDSFGQGTSKMIYLRFKKESNFSREDMVFKPEEFKEHLENMFETGNKLFERALVKELCSEFDLQTDDRFDIVGALVQAKNIALKNQENPIIA
jgi:hypothetical protein